ncbi:hypothetical protein [Shimia ponticola]|uniref:hypothetical protein n=1 Tax=Shimia ponticola TaxID=2582893 RepID=UPI0011BF943E|nr:hypothetical protein [Shimia ponticola]
MSFGLAVVNRTLERKVGPTTAIERIPPSADDHEKRQWEGKAHEILLERCRERRLVNTSEAMCEDQNKGESGDQSCAHAQEDKQSQTQHERKMCRMQCRDLAGAQTKDVCAIRVVDEGVGGIANFLQIKKRQVHERVTGDDP